MVVTGSVTEWVARLKAGDQAAAQGLWERYFHRLVLLARQRLRAAPRRVADEEDVALSAFDSFCRGAACGRFPLLTDRNSLWPLLVVITARKARDLRKRETRQKRHPGPVVSAGSRPEDSHTAAPTLDELIGREPSPAFAAEVADECRRLLDLLGDERLRRIAQLKMEGYTDEEVARQMGCVSRTVRRRLQLIRKIWQAEAAP
jgi:DNA-directed RNA polymerase specialized sigma24 family protein